MCRQRPASWVIVHVVVKSGSVGLSQADMREGPSMGLGSFEEVKWMMYWIIFAIFTTVETFTDIFLCWFPFYYELKIAFVAWLLSPYTKGSSLLYRKFVHPTLSSKEKEIDDCLIQAKDRSYDALVHFGKRGLNVAATAAVMAASKGQGALSERLRSFSMQDLTTIRGESSSAVSPPPSAPTISVRKSIKQSQPKTARTASGSAGCLGQCVGVIVKI
uniref:Receptor expression-enhancing protein 1 n=1 Tax=Sphaerodactylus townsendi TaxID=933632 RepID=A0ACB8EUV8_9SAUR